MDTNSNSQGNAPESRPIQIAAGPVNLVGQLQLPTDARGLVIFTDGSGSASDSPVLRAVANTLASAGIAALILDIFTNDEESTDRATGVLRFDIGLLSQRVVWTGNWLNKHDETSNLRLGYYGVGLGGAAVSAAAVARPDLVGALVIQSGRVDLKDARVNELLAPTLLLAGEKNQDSVQRITIAFQRLEHVEHKDYQIIPNASSRLDEPASMQEVSKMALTWFSRYLVPFV